MENHNAFLGTLTHNDLLHARMAKSFFSHASQKCNLLIQVQPGSLLAQSYNTLWCKALNLRSKQNLKWFAVLHADVVPQDFWLDKLIDLAEQYDADVMSAIVPIKEASGVTSTAISGTDRFTRHTRLTQAQINSKGWPATFDIDILRENSFIPEEARIDVKEDARLLVNTGCFVCRLDREWCSNVEFTINDRIIQILGGSYVAQVEPEDWYFSRRVAELGGRVMATREVVAEHIGSVPYVSNKVWGQMIDQKGAYQK